MSVTYGFYNSTNHDRRYDAIQMSSIFDGIIKDGIFMSIGTCMVVKADSGMMITVGDGRAWFNHTWTLNDSLLPLEVPQSELILNRTDAVVLEINAEESIRANEIKIVKGTPATNPVPPTMIDIENVHQYPLAYIYVGKGVTEITPANITNMVGTSSTPYVTGILETVNIDNLVAQWEAQWSEFYNAETGDMNETSQHWKNTWDEWFRTYTQASSGEMSEWETEQKEDFVDWYESLQDLLDGDVAAKLAKEILELQKITAAIEECCNGLATEQALYKGIEDSDGESVQDSNGDAISGRIVFVIK